MAPEYLSRPPQSPLTRSSENIGEKLLKVPGIKPTVETLKKPEVQVAIAGLISALFGLAAREFSLEDAWAMLTERAASSTTVDTGPTDVERLWYEIFSAGSFIVTAGLAAKYGIWDKIVQHQQRELGVASIPKHWDNTILVADPERTIFDELAEEFPDNYMALLHTGKQSREGGGVIGDPLPEGTMHLTSFGQEHYTDPTFLKKTQPQNSLFWLMNCCKPDSLIFSAERGDIPESHLNSLNAHTMVMNVNDWKFQNTIVLTPKNALIHEKRADEYFVTERFSGQNVISLCPEDIVFDFMEEEFNKEAIKSVGVLCDLDNIKELIAQELKERKLEVVDSALAQALLIYGSTDHSVLVHCKDLESDTRPVYSLLERRASVEQVKKAKSIPLLIPQIVTRYIYDMQSTLTANPNMWLYKRYADIHTS